ncbi:Cytochrome P450 52A12 [Lachnellula arida]|uniref:Cytochrome P450 52A12 n=1 Tax=Lachnellula arida TaxID=1316785 RepID=A0A8T9BPM2_9HELO|nr:Cytochrome P450 52A12 [Lachnellula arida]
MPIPIPTTSLLGLAYIIAAYFLYMSLSSILSSRQNSAKARQLKCQDPPELKSRYPFGIDLLLRLRDADKAKLFPVDLTQRFIDVGAITYKYTLPGSHTISTMDPKNIQAILATQFKDFDLGSTRRGNFWPLLGNGIFTQDGEGWQHSRLMMRPQFAREQVSDLNLEETHGENIILEDHCTSEWLLTRTSSSTVQNLMRALDLSLTSGNWIESVDLRVLFFRLTLDSATEFLFGTSVDSQLDVFPSHGKLHSAAGAPNSSEFATAFDEAQNTLAARDRLDRLYWIFSPNKFKKNCKICHDFVDHFVRLALAKDPWEKQQRSDGTAEKYVFLDALTTQTRDPEELRTQALNLLLAGRDTTASLLSWLFLRLSQDPVRYKKLRDIIIEEFGTYDEPSGVTFSRLKNCRYLQHCNNEALRLHPAVPVNARTANKDTTIPKGGGQDRLSPIFIPKGMAVEYSVHAMHHRADVWGPDVELFNPERWEGRKVGWEYLPFNGGPRICLGQQFSLTEASYVTMRLIQRFDKMEYLGKDPVIRHNLALTNSPADPVEIRMHAA